MPRASDRSSSRRNIVIVATATVASRVVALVREATVAGIFGVSAAMSAFTVAFQVPNLLRSLLADAALQGSFVPVFAAHIRRHERDEAMRTLTSVLILATLVAGFACFALTLFAPALVALLVPGLSASDAHLASSLTRVMVPVSWLFCVVSILVGALNTLGTFTIGALLPAIWNLIIVAVLLLGMAVLPADVGIYAYAAAVSVATVAQTVILVPSLRRHQVRVTPLRVALSPSVRRVVRTMVPVAIALGMMNFVLLLATLFGSLVSDAAPAAIDKAFRLWQLPQGVVAVAIGTVVFPALASSAAVRDFSTLRLDLVNACRVTIMVLVPCAALLAALAEPIVEIAYQRGAFDEYATELTASALRYWAIALPFAGVSSVLWRAIFSLTPGRSALVFASINIGVAGLAAGALWPALGVPGIIIGAATGSITMATAQAIYLCRLLEVPITRQSVATLVPPTICGLAGAAAGFLTFSALDFGSAPALLVAQLAAASLATLTGVLLCAVAMRTPEASFVLPIVRTAARGFRKST